MVGILIWVFVFQLATETQTLKTLLNLQQLLEDQDEEEMEVSLSQVIISWKGGQ